MTPDLWVVQAKDALAEGLAQGLERARRRSAPVLVSLAQPVSAGGGPLAVFGARRRFESYAAFWARPDQSFWLVGIGSAIVMARDGASLKDGVDEEFRSLLDSAVIRAPARRGIGPIFMGGFRYDPQAPRDAIWRGFPDALLALPRFLFTWSEGATWLTINIIVSPEADATALAEATIAQMRFLEAEPFAESSQLGLDRQCQSSPGEWTHWVRQALQAIEAGHLTKVVLARRKALHSQGSFSLDGALGYLIKSYPSCAVFAMDSGEASFVGATPEALVRVEDGKVSLRCLAGSAARGASPEEDRELQRLLLESPKERLEHSTVVAMVAEALNGMCHDLRWDNEPHVIKLKTVQHMATSFTGCLNGGGGILQLVRLLHPTPAVGGAPKDKALDMIRDLEGDRGWYAAPVGWLDHNGEGEFSVAIRSALLRGNEATLFAGSGIVSGSDPVQEYQETELKFQPLLAALTGG
ncbi:MAG: isochorismate synthase [Chloroflexi bacterium]|nr:isochorismate synthase [Chloroflexota bacterium]